MQWRYWCYSCLCSFTLYFQLSYLLWVLFFSQFTFQKKNYFSTIFKVNNRNTIEKVVNMFKENNEGNKTTPMKPLRCLLLLTLNIFNSFFLAFLLLTLNRYMFTRKWLTFWNLWWIYLWWTFSEITLKPIIPWIT